MMRLHEDRRGFSISLPYRGSALSQIVLSVRIGRVGRGIHFDRCGLRRVILYALR